LKVSEVNETGDRLTRLLRWSARAIGSLPALGWVSVALLGALSEREPWTWESAGMVAFIVALALAVLLAWRRERLGGALLLVCAAGFCLFAYLTAGRNKGFAVLVSGGPFLLSAALFLAAWWRQTGARVA
jgi:hypothetical protein